MSKQTQTKPLSTAARVGLSAVGALGLLLGLYFAIGGGLLAVRGGTWYYLLMGLAVCATGIQFARRRSSAYVIFLIAVVATALWAVWESGFDFWPLQARIFMFTMLAMLLAPVYPVLRRLEGKSPAKGAAWTVGLVLLACNATFVYGMFIPHGTFGTPSAAALAKGDIGTGDWSAYGHSAGGDRFVGFPQINRDNVRNLQVAWTFHTGDVPLSPTGGGAEDQETPLQIGDTLFVCSPQQGDRGRCRERSREVAP
jgi:quinate dehydrogenase (quinone)